VYQISDSGIQCYVMRKKFGDTIAIILIILSIIYLVNPGFGFFEVLPDNMPIIGNLDELAASVILIGSMEFLGVDIYRYFRKKNLADKLYEEKKK